MGSKMEQDKGRGSERPSGRATPPRNAGREAGLRDFHRGDHRWSVDLRLAVKGGRVNMQPASLQAFLSLPAGVTVGVYGIFSEQTISISVFAHQMITF